MYLPKSKYTRITVTPNQGAIDSDGRPYAGPAIKDFLGTIYKGTSPENISGELKFPEPEPSRDLTYLYVKPTDQDYEKGEYTRYFVKDLRTGKIYEVDKRRYGVEKSLGLNFIQILKIKGNLAGPLENTLHGGYLFYGTRAMNAKIVEEADKEMAGLKDQILKDPTQFVRN